MNIIPISFDTSTQTGDTTISPVIVVDNPTLDTTTSGNNINTIGVDLSTPIVFSSTPIASAIPINDYIATLDRLSEIATIKDAFNKDSGPYNEVGILNDFFASNQGAYMYLTDLANSVKGTFQYISNIVKENDTLYASKFDLNAKGVAALAQSVQYAQDYIDTKYASWQLTASGIRTEIADSIDYNNGQMRTYMNTIVNTAKENTATITAKLFNDFNKSMTETYTTIKQYSDSITLFASKSEVNAMGLTVNQSSANLKVLTDQIASSVKQVDFSLLQGNLKGVIDNQVVFNRDLLTVQNAASTAVANIAAINQLLLDNGIDTDITTNLGSELAAVTVAYNNLKNDFAGLTSIVTNQTSSITQLSNSITSKVDQTTFDLTKGVVTQQGSAITQLSTDISLKVSKTDFDITNQNVTDAKTSISILTNSISNKVDVLVFNALSSTVSQQGTSITQLANSITSKVSSTDYNTNNTAIGTRFSQVEQTASKWSLILNENGTAKAAVIVDAINGGSVNIAAARVNISGDTTFSAKYDPSKKIQNFNTQPTHPYFVNDLYCDATGIIWKCAKDSLVGGYSVSDWVLASKYTDDTEALSKSTKFIGGTDPSSTWTTDVKKRSHLNDTWITNSLGGSANSEYTYYEVSANVYGWIRSKTSIDGGQIDTGVISADYIDVASLFTKELTANNFNLKGRVGNFEVKKSLIGYGINELTGTETGNRIIIDPDRNEIVFESGGTKGIRITGDGLTPLAYLQTTGNTIYYTNGTTFLTGNSVVCSYNDVANNTNNVKAFVAGIKSNQPFISTAPADSTSKISLGTVGKTLIYSINFPYQVKLKHNGLTCDGRPYRLTGAVDISVNVKLKGDAGTIATETELIHVNVDSGTTGDSYCFNRLERFNVQTVGVSNYYFEVTVNILNPGGRLLRYQTFNHSTWASHSYWSEQYNEPITYELTIDRNFSIDSSIGITEIAKNGIQSVWSASRYIRVDGNPNNSVFIETAGKWLHNGIEVKFDSATITGYIDQSIFATKNYVDTGFLKSNGGVLGGDLTIQGNLYLQGTGKYLVTEEVLSENDFVTLRANNPINLPDGLYTGFKGLRVYPNGDSAYLVYGNDGMARVGKSTSLQVLATREDNPTNGGIAVWSTSNKRFEATNTINNITVTGNIITNGTMTVTGESIYNKYEGNQFKLATRNNTVYIQSNNKFDITGESGSILPNGVDFYTNIDNVRINGNRVFNAGNLNRNDTDFIARNITASGNVDLTGVDSNLFVGRTTGVATNKYATRLKLGTARHTGSDAWYFGVDDNDDDSYLRIGYDTTNSAIRFRHDKTAFFGGDIKSWGATGAGFTATGWGITNDGDANFRNHIVRGKLTTYELVQNKISIANGNMIVSDNAKGDVAEDYITQYGLFRIYFKEQHPFLVGDTLLCKTNGKNYTVLVGRTDSSLLWIDTYLNPATVKVNYAVGDFFVRWNSTDAARKGLLYLCSSDAGSPNYQVIYDGQVKAQFGNLEGRAWNGGTLPANTWGSWAENGYFSGAINATSGKIGGLDISDNRLINTTGGYGGRVMMTSLSSLEKGSGAFWGSGYHTSKGFNFNYDTPHDAWSIVAGQMWDTIGATSTTGSNYGFQMINNSNYELLAVGSNYTTGVGFGRLANGAISWDMLGNVTFAESVKMQWQSGSRNYVPNSKGDNATGWSCSGIYNGNFLRDVSTAAENFILSPYFYLPEAGVYTISFFIDTTGNVSSAEVYGLPENWGTTGIPLTSGVITTRNGRYKQTFTVNSNQLKFQLRFDNNGSTNGSAASLYIAKVKVEKGYNATDWTPALEDIDGKLTQITANGVYIGTIQATNIIGDVINGKTITAVDGVTGNKILELHGSLGTLTGYDSTGLQQSQLSRNSLSFFDNLGVPSVFIRGSDISLLDCKQGSNASANAVDIVPLGENTAFSSAFTISDKGVYKGVVPIVVSGNCTSDVERDMVMESELVISVSCVVNLQYLNGSTWENYITNVSNRSFSNSSSRNSVNVNGDVDVPISFTVDKTGSFRLSYSHTRSTWASATATNGDPALVEVVSETSTVNNDDWVTLWHVSNGTYIGSNGFVSYNNTYGEKYIVFDRTDMYQFRTKAEQCLTSSDEWTQVYITTEGVKIRTAGQDRLLILSDGKIKFLNFPAVALNTGGTDDARYRLYVDGNGILCRNSGSAW